MNTVGQLYPLIRSQAGSAGACDVDALIARMNVIGPELLDRIEAKGTVTVWCLPVCQNCVVLPADLDTPIQAWLDGKPLGFRGEFWLGRLGGDIPSDMRQECPWQELVDDSRVAYTQLFPVPFCQNSVFEFVARSRKDAGKKVDLRYRRGPTGREYTYNATLAGDRVSSSPSDTGIGDVTFISKPRTEAAIELWVRDLRSGVRMLVAVYDPRDEQPSFRLVHVTGCANGKLVVKGKRKWLPLATADDVVPFGRVAVWRAALIAEGHLANRNLEEFAVAVEVAINLLDAEITGLRPRGTAEVVDFITPFTLQNRRR